MHFGVMTHLSEVYGGLDGGFPLVAFSQASLDTMVISPLGNFMDVNQASWKTSKGLSVFGFGPIGSLQQVCWERLFCVLVTRCCVRTYVRMCAQVSRFCA